MVFHATGAMDWLDFTAAIKSYGDGRQAQWIGLTLLLLLKAMGMALPKDSLVGNLERSAWE